MNQNFSNNLEEICAKKATLLWAAMTVFPLCVGFIGYSVVFDQNFQTSSDAPVGTEFISVFGILVLAASIISLSLHRRYFSAHHYETLQNTELRGEGFGGFFSLQERSAFDKKRPLEERRPLVYAFMLQVHIFKFALNEAIAVSGLAFSMVTQLIEPLLVGVGLALLLQCSMYPRIREIGDELRRRQLL